MKWLDLKVSFYNYNRDVIGRNDFTFRDILFSQFAVPHIIDGQKYCDLDTIVALRKLDKNVPDYEKTKTKMKNTLQAFTPAALLKTREKGNVVEINRTGLMQLDFDKKDNPKWDMDKLMIEVFNKYSFIAFAEKSCSGDGFYCLVAIAEPDKLREYAEQLFHIFKKYEINIDTTKGRNVHDLRYLSYHSNLKFREDPEPLKINTFFKDREAGQEAKVEPGGKIIGNLDLVAEHWLRKLKSCVPGNRMPTIQAVAAALGSKRVKKYWFLILEEIKTNPVFEDEREEFLKCAKDCFEWGWKNQMDKDLQAR